MEENEFQCLQQELKRNFKIIFYDLFENYGKEGIGAILKFRIQGIIDSLIAIQKEAHFI